MSVPGLVVLYGGVMQKRWSVNSMMLTFVAFAVVLVAWVLWASRWASAPTDLEAATASSESNFIGQVGLRPDHGRSRGGQAVIPSITEGPPFHFPIDSLVYFQFVFAAITPILMLGSVLGRINFKAWIPFVLLWITFVSTRSTRS
jgi:Amt family ammonium transporter